jgi:hypothetical protein
MSDTNTGHSKVVVNRCMSLDGFIANESCDSAGRKAMFSRARAVYSASTLVTIVVLALTGSPSAATAAQGSNHAALRSAIVAPSRLRGVLRGLD